MSQSLVTYSKSNPIIYSDINYNYGNTAQNNVPLLFNLNAVIEKIINVIFTPLETRHFEPEFGSEFPEIVFTNLTPQNSYTYLVEIESAIREWLPFITLDRAKSSIQGSDSMSAYILYLVYYIAGIQEPQNLTLAY